MSLVDDVGSAAQVDRPGREQGPWYVVHAKARKESFARTRLEDRGVEVFFPQLRLPHHLRGRGSVVPLFPGYLFVRTDPVSAFYTVVWTPGVKGFVGPGGVPAAVDQEVVAFLMRRASTDGLLVARSSLSPGQEVEISRGPFAGLVGVIEHPPDARGRVRLLMQLLNRRPVRVEVPFHFVKSGWIA